MSKTYRVIDQIKFSKEDDHYQYQGVLFAIFDADNGVFEVYSNLGRTDGKNFETLPDFFSHDVVETLVEAYEAFETKRKSIAEFLK